MMRKKHVLAILFSMVLLCTSTCIAMAVTANVETLSWSCTATTDNANVIFTSSTDGFVFENKADADFSKVISNGVNFNQNKTSFDMKIEPTSGKPIPADWCTMIQLYGKDLGNDPWGNMDGVFLQINPTKTLIQVPQNCASGNAKSMLEIPFSIADGEIHNISIYMDVAEKKVSIVFDNDFAEKNFTIVSEDLLNNNEGGFYFMTRNSKLTITNFKMENVNLNRNFENPKFYIEGGAAVYTDFASSNGSSFGGEGLKYASPASIGADAPINFRSNEYSFDFCRTENTATAGYLIFTMRSSSKLGASWDNNQKIYFMQEVGGKIKLVVSKSGATAPEVVKSSEFAEGITILDGNKHTVKIVIDDNNKKITGIIDNDAKAEIVGLSAGDILKSGANTFISSNITGKISNYSSFIYSPDFTKMTNNNVSFAKPSDWATKVAGSDASIVTKGKTDTHSLARLSGTTGEAFVRADKDDYTADFYSFKVSAKRAATNSYFGIVVRGEKASTTAFMSDTINNGLKLLYHIQTDKSDPLNYNKTAKGADSANAYYFQNICDGLEHYVEIQIYDSKTTENVRVSMDGRDMWLTTEKLPAKGGIYFFTSGISATVKEIKAYDTSVPVASISLKKTAGTIALTDAIKTIQLESTILPENASNKNVTYSVEDSTIASVTDNGLISAIAVGTTKVIVASAENSTIKAEFNLSVTEGVIPATGVNFVNNSGETITVKKIEITKTYSVEYSVIPSNAKISSVTFTSQDSTVATVDTDGVITAVKKGTTTVTININESQVVAQLNITVIGVQPTRVEVREDKASGAKLDAIRLGEESTIKVKGVIFPLTAEDKTVTITIADTNIATVIDGVVTGILAGDTTLTVEAVNGIKTQIPVKILAKVIPPEQDSTLKDYQKQKFIQGTHPGLVDKITFGSEIQLRSSGAGDTPLLFNKNSIESTAIPDNKSKADTFVFNIQVQPNSKHGDFLAAVAVGLYGDTDADGPGVAFFSAKNAVALVIFGNSTQLIIRNGGIQTVLETFTPGANIPNLADGLKHYATLKIDAKNSKIIVKLDNFAAIEVEVPVDKGLKAEGGWQIMAHNTTVDCTQFDIYNTAISLPTAITFTDEKIEIKVGDSYELIPKVVGNGEFIKDVVYSSSDPSKVTVDEKGKITAKSECSGIVITVTSKYDANIKGTIKVNVLAKENEAPKEPAKKGCGSIINNSFIEFGGLLIIIFTSLACVVFRAKKSRNK